MTRRADKKPFENVLLEQPEAGIYSLTVNRPKALNALDAATLDEIDAAIRAVALDDDARVLLALHRERTLRGAAQTLGVNASTIGRRLDALEKALQARLFDRRLDGVQPTEAAERLLVHAEQLEQAALGLLAAADGLEREPEGVVRLSALPGSC